MRVPRVVLALVLVLPGAAFAQAPPRATIESIPRLAAVRSAGLDAVLAEARAAMHVRLPRLSPRADSRKAAAWAQRRFAPWVAERSRAMSLTERASYTLYLQVGLEGALAAAIVGVVYEDFVEIAVQVPVPRDLARDPDLRAAYAGAFREAFAPTATVAESAYGRCASSARGIGEDALAEWCEARALATRQSIEQP